ncbi:hypothetical protein Tco_0616889, partial [Tanacetum coccineum]
MHRRNEAISSSSSLLDGGSSTVPLCLSEEYEDHLRTSSEPNELKAYNPKDNKCRYNRKGFLEDDDNNGDSI